MSHPVAIYAYLAVLLSLFTTITSCKPRMENAGSSVKASEEGGNGNPLDERVIVSSAAIGKNGTPRNTYKVLIIYNLLLLST